MKSLKNTKIKPYFIAGCLMLIAGIMYLIDHQISFAMIFIALGGMFMTLNFTITEKERPLNVKLIEADPVFSTFIREEQRVEAIKRCRQVTACSLKDAADYVDSKLS